MVEQGAIPVMQNLEFRAVENFLNNFKTIFERRKERVPLDDSFHQREVKIGTKRQSLRINLRAAANKIVHRRIRRAEFQEIFNDAQVNGGHTANFGKLELVRRRICRLAPGNPRLAEQIRKFPLQQSRMPTKNDVDAIGQWLAEALESFSSDYDDVAPGHFLEPFEIL